MSRCSKIKNRLSRCSGGTTRKSSHEEEALVSVLESQGLSLWNDAVTGAIFSELGGLFKMQRIDLLLSTICQGQCQRNFLHFKKRL